MNINKEMNKLYSYQRYVLQLVVKIKIKNPTAYKDFIDEYKYAKFDNPNANKSIFILLHIVEKNSTLIIMLKELLGSEYSISATANKDIHIRNKKGMHFFLYEKVFDTLIYSDVVRIY